jgi:hypothetical protein
VLILSAHNIIAQAIPHLLNGSAEGRLLRNPQAA